MEDFIKKYYREILILCTVLLDIFGFTGLLTPEMEIIDKLISWVVFAILFYDLSITRLFFENTDKKIDFFILFSYYLLIAKNFLLLLSSKFEELQHGGLFHRLASVAMDKYMTLDIIVVSFYAATILIIFISVYTAKTMKYSKKSIFAVLMNDTVETQEGYVGVSDRSPSTAAKAFMSFFLYNTFFILIFNIMQEWLGYIEDDLITIVSILFVILIYRKHRENKINIKIIDDITEVSDTFYKNVISAIDKIRYIKLLATAILSLQILTDFFIFVSPIFLGQTEINYLGKLTGHDTILTLLLSDLLKVPAIAGKIQLTLVYLLCGAFIVLIMLLPSYIWYLTYTEKKETIPSPVIVLFFMSFAAFMLSPIMKLKTIDKSLQLFGVDIIMNPVLSVSHTALPVILFISLAAGLVAFMTYKYIRKFTLLLFSAINCSFIVIYIFYFLAGTAEVFLDNIYWLTAANHVFISTYFYFFLLIMILFYIGAAISYVHELNNEFEFIKPKNRFTEEED